MTGTEDRPRDRAQAEAGGAAAAEIAAQAESGPRHPDRPIARLAITLLCLGWSGYQLYIAFQPINATVARAWHLAFAVLLVYLAYPAFNEAKPPFWVKAWRRLRPAPARSNRRYIPIPDAVLGVIGCVAALYIWWDYEGIVMRQGLPSTLDVWAGVVMIVVLLEAARRALGLALPILALIFLGYSFVGPYMPDILRHRGIPLEYVINDQYLSTTGILGVPLGVSTDFVFLFVLFGALLDRAGAGRYFVDVAFAGLGWMRGGPAKAAVVASGLTGLVSGSSIANTVTTGTFTIPLMKRVGLPAHKAAAIEVAASTNGQLMPPIMGAAAFIMAEIIGIPYLDVVRAALFPALISYMALFYVVHLEARKLDLKPLKRHELPALLPTLLRGLHYLLPVVVLLVYLVVLRRFAIASALLAIEALAVLMLVQRPIIAYLAYGRHRASGALEPGDSLAGALRVSVMLSLRDIWEGLIAGARNMIAVGAATATAGIIVGVVTSTGLVGRFVTLIERASMGSVSLMLVLTAITSLILGMGLPTTANYIVMATLTAPVIVALGSDAGLVFPLIAAHLFVFYFGILADDTPPVGLAAYAAAAIGRTDPIRTGIQGFTYDLRTAILPFVFIFNAELLMIGGVGEGGAIVWIDDPLRLIWIFLVSLIAMFAFAAAIQGFFAARCGIIERLILLALCVLLFRPAVVAEPLALAREVVQALALAAVAVLYGVQRLRSGGWRRPRGVTSRR